MTVNQDLQLKRHNELYTSNKSIHFKDPNLLKRYKGSTETNTDKEAHSFALASFIDGSFANLIYSMHPVY